MDNFLHNLPKLPLEVKMLNIPIPVKDIESIIEKSFPSKQNKLFKFRQDSQFHGQIFPNSQGGNNTNLTTHSS